MEKLKKAEPRRQLSPHFMEVELACRCCGMLRVYPELINKLELLRRLVGKPVLVNSGYRCSTHNRAVGGAVNSYHLQGMAADIRVLDMAVKEVAHFAEKSGFDGIGIYPSQGFVHVDVRGYRARWKG